MHTLGSVDGLQVTLSGGQARSPLFQGSHRPPTSSTNRSPGFEDGSVFLVSHNTDFRVYKRFLCEHSPVFRDLFQIAQPPDAHKIEGCPVVMLSDHP